MDSFALFLGIWVLAALITVVLVGRFLAYGTGADAHLPEPVPGRRIRSWAPLRAAMPLAVASALLLAIGELVLAPEPRQMRTPAVADLVPGAVQLAEPPRERVRASRTRPVRRPRPQRTAAAAVTTPAASVAAPVAAAAPVRRRVVAPAPSLRRRAPSRTSRPSRPLPTFSPAPSPTPAPTGEPVAILAAAPAPAPESAAAPGGKHHGNGKGKPQGKPGKPGRKG